ncbi:carbohydrate ABC transporter permease [Caldicellulosiruptoraceae bacterium PP1]
MKKILSKLTPVLFIGPHFILFLIFLIYPTFYGLYISFFKWDFMTEPKFVGFKNYMDLFNKETIDYSEFWSSLWHTIEFVIFSVPLLIAVAFILALLLNEKIPFKNFFRTIFYMPVALSVSTICLIWMWVFDSNAGILNYYFGIKTPWLSDLPYAWIALVIMTIWWTIGNNMVIFLAGLQDVPEEYYEASRIDGANWFQQLFHITLPSLKPTFLFITITSTIASFNLFGQPYIATRGGPGTATRTAVMYIRDVGFSQYRMGSAAAMAILMGLIMIVISIFQYRIMDRE